MNNKDTLLGNEIIALGLLEAQCQIATAYPGTPATEINSSLVKWKKKYQHPINIEWSVNEKVAMEIAIGAAWANKRSVVSMKMVGLNVAADPLTSAAYTGVVGGLLVISADDPGPHSSQTEQDSRYFAKFALIPALDPISPAEAREMIKYGFELSEKYQIPVMLRPSLRVCHAKQSVPIPDTLPALERKAQFDRNPARWAATPKFRYLLHVELNKKFTNMTANEALDNPFTHYSGIKKGKLGIITSGVVAGAVLDYVKEADIDQHVGILRLGLVYPINDKVLNDFMGNFDRILVIEETYPLIEEHAARLVEPDKVIGRITGHVPNAGELTPELVNSLVYNVNNDLKLGFKLTSPNWNQDTKAIQAIGLPVRKPALCPGCPHRTTFHSIRRANAKAIYTSDIGCYTLGLNQMAVDTVLDMGAAISQAIGMAKAYGQDGVDQPIVATIGDATFFHSGMTGLLDAVYNRVGIVLVIMDNGTTAMTGDQPTPQHDVTIDGSPANPVPLEHIVRGLGVKFLEIEDPFHQKDLTKLVKDALKFAKEHSSPAVIISRRVCTLYGGGIPDLEKITTEVDPKICNACGYCQEYFNCPALHWNADGTKVIVDPVLCAECGSCIYICAKHAIKEVVKS